MRVIVEVQKKVDAFTNCHAEKKNIYYVWYSHIRGTDPETEWDKFDKKV